MKPNDTGVPSDAPLADPNRPQISLREDDNSPPLASEARSSVVAAPRTRLRLLRYWEQHRARLNADNDWAASAQAARMQQDARCAEVALWMAELASSRRKTRVPRSAELSSELSRLSLQWSLRAQPAATEGRASTRSSASAHGETPLESSQLEKWCSSSEDASRVQSVLSNHDFASLAQLPASELGALQLPLLRAARGSVQSLRRDNWRSTDRRWLRRTLRQLLLFILAAGALLVAIFGREWRDQRLDLAAGKPWRVSSGLTPCHSPVQDCPEGKDYFFHTNEEENPWFEIDLGSDQDISALSIVNRLDCCQERAVPLRVSAGTKLGVLKTATMIREPFDSVRVSFPKTRARFVRLTIDGRSNLHLKQVRVFP